MAKIKQFEIDGDYLYALSEEGNLFYCELVADEPPEWYPVPLEPKFIKPLGVEAEKEVKS